MTPKNDAPGGLSANEITGWIEAGLFVIAVSTLNVLYAYAVAQGANVIVFVLYALTGASVAMLAASGVGRHAWDVIRTPQSWVFGAASVALEAVYFLLVGLVSPAEASLMARLSVPASLLIGWALFSAGLSLRQVIGGAIVIAAVGPVLAWVPDEKQTMAATLGIACALAVAIKTFASEFHPWNCKASCISQKVRVTGLVVLATTVLSFAATGAATLAAALGSSTAAALAPPLAAYMHGPTIALALVFGAAILTAMTYLQFASVVRIGTSNFLATSAFAPLSAYALQTLAAGIGLITAPAFEVAMLLPILIGIGGVLLIVKAGNGT